MSDVNPTISVLMGVYYRSNDIALLKRSVTSILSQTFSSFELLICDDGSTSDALSFLDALAHADSRIRLIRRGDLLALPAKLNACLAEAKGDWIARMDDDDYSHPKRFERQLEYLASHSRIAFVGCCVGLYQGGEKVGDRFLPKYPQAKDFYMVQPYIHPALMFRREALEAVEGYSEDKHCLLCEDYDLLLRLYAAGYKGANLQEILFDYTVPATARGSRRMSHRWNEAVTRYRRFRQLGVLPRALPYVVKPLAVGLLPETMLKTLKGMRS